MANNRITDFRPSTHGLHFGNAFPAAPVLTIPVPGIGSFGIGNAAGGMCGGMVFTVCDFYEAGQPPPDVTEPPDRNTTLFRYLTRRLMDSFDLPGGVLKYYAWMTYPDGNTWRARGLAWRTIREEWPRIRAMIDSGHPCPLGLVTVQSFAPQRLGENHQVLAYAYKLDGQHLTLYVYDPNRPNEDEVALTLAIDRPTQARPIAYSTGMPVRGFFVTSYAAIELTSLA
jgi:hypothetical protein